MHKFQQKLTRLVTVLFILFLTNCIYAQSFNGGFFGGLTASEVSGDNLSGPNKLGFNAGLFTNINLNDNSAIEMQIMYIQKGSKKNPNERNGFTSYRFQLDYVEIPVMYKFSIPLLDKIKYIGKISYEAGLSYARLMRYKELDNDREVLPGEKEPYYYNESNLILGFYYPLGERLDLSFRSSNSITPIRPHKGRATVWYNWGQYHTVWTINLNYRFK